MGCSQRSCVQGVADLTSRSSRLHVPFGSFLQRKKVELREELQAIIMSLDASEAERDKVRAEPEESQRQEQEAKDEVVDLRVALQLVKDDLAASTGGETSPRVRANLECMKQREVVCPETEDGGWEERKEVEPEGDMQVRASTCHTSPLGLSWA